jgi:hypothetical protein
MNRRIILFGTSGFTGQKVLRELLDSGENPTLAGRDTAALDELSYAMGCDVPVHRVDVTDRAALDRFISADDVVISTVGPFLRLGAGVVGASAAKGACYFDSTGEPAFIGEVFTTYGPLAAKTGALLCPAFGYCFAPGNFAAALAVSEAGDACRRVDVGYFVQPGIPLDSGGQRSPGLRKALQFTSGRTRSALVAALAEKSFSYRHGQLVTERLGRRRHSLLADGKLRQGFTAGGSEHFGLPAAYPGLTDVNVVLGWFDRSSPALQFALAVAAPLSGWPWPKGPLTRLSEALPAADRKPSGPAWSLIAAEAKDTAGRLLARVELQGPEPYLLTARLLAWAAQQAAQDTPHPAGAHGPVTAFGLQTLEAGCEGLGLLRREPIR